MVLFKSAVEYLSFSTCNGCYNFNKWAELPAIGINNIFINISNKLFSGMSHLDRHYLVDDFLLGLPTNLGGNGGVFVSTKMIL